MRVHWTKRATKRLRAIHEHIAKDSPKNAANEVTKIINRSRLLGEHPDTGHRLVEFEDTGLREVLARPYRIIYLRREHEVDVITVMHYRQLLPSDLAPFKRKKS